MDVLFGLHSGRRDLLGLMMAKSVRFPCADRWTFRMLRRGVCLVCSTDILEGINLMTDNQMAIHTTAGCTTDNAIVQSGKIGFQDCSADPGCTVHETKPNSFGAGFAAAGGGVWATQFDVAGIYMWFWSVSDPLLSVGEAGVPM